VPLLSELDLDGNAHSSVIPASIWSLCNLLIELCLRGNAPVGDGAHGGVEVAWSKNTNGHR
jgi:hypothetical protein